MRDINSRWLSIFLVGGMAALLLLSCKLDNPTNPTLSSWGVQLNIPLLQQEVTLRELSEDSLITTMAVGNSGDSLFLFQDAFSIDSVEVGNQLEIDDIHKRFTQTVDDVTIDSDTKHDEVGFEEASIQDVNKSVTSEVGIITLENTEPDSSEPFTFRQIMPPDLVSSMEQTIQNNGGEATFDSVPGRSLQPQEKPFTFQKFESVHLSSGFLDISVVNRMFIPLGQPITVSLRYSNGVEFASRTFPNHIPINGSDTRTIDLSGDSLGANILIQVTGESDGSQGQPVTIDTADLSRGFFVVVQVRDLEATRANAKIPGQTITHSDTIPLQQSDNKIERARLRTGTLSLDINNNLSVASDIILRIPSMVDNNGNVYERGPFTVQPNDNLQQNFSIAQQTLVMDTSTQVVEYEYEVQTISSGDVYREINQDDSVNVNVSLSNMVISRIKGVLEPKQTIEPGDIPITSNNEILNAVISDGEILLNINNQIGGQPHLRLTLHQIFTSQGSNDTLVHEIDVDSGQTVSTIPLDGAEIRIPRNDQTLYYTTVTNGGGVYATYNLDDSVAVDIEISELTITEATGYFTQDAMMESDTISLNNATKVEQAVIDSGSLSMRIVNDIGVEARVRLILEEFRSNGESLDTVLQIPETSVPVTREIPLAGYVIEMPLSDQSVHYTSRTRLYQDSLMTLSLDDSIQVNVDITGLSFSRVTGEIDPVQIELAPIEQEITAIPEQLEGVQFRHVDMDLDFDTNIGIPVFLDLRIKAVGAGGDSVISEVTHWNITDSNVVSIPNAEELINIFPDRIIASGQATAGAPGEVGTVASNQYVTGEMKISAPMEFEITPDAVVHLDPEPVDEDIPDELLSVILFANMDNQFEFGAKIHVLAANDTNYFHENSPQAPDTLAILQIPAAQISQDSVSLGTDQFGLFSDSLFLKTGVQLLGNTDNQGNPVPSRFLSTDSLRINMYGRIQAKIAPKLEE